MLACHYDVVGFVVPLFAKCNRIPHTILAFFWGMAVLCQWLCSTSDYISPLLICLVWLPAIVLVWLREAAFTGELTKASSRIIGVQFVFMLYSCISYININKSNCSILQPDSNVTKQSLCVCTWFCLPNGPAVQYTSHLLQCCRCSIVCINHLPDVLFSFDALAQVFLQLYSIDLRSLPHLVLCHIYHLLMH